MTAAVVPTDAQRRAIEAPLGPVLVVAGPGAGKTFCLINRIRYLIERGMIAPKRMCAVTFTNKAAQEIAHRLREAIGPRVEEITGGTLHALCAAMVREHAAVVGLRPGFGIADEDYQRRVLSRLRVRRERHRQLLTSFGRHRLQGYVMTAGDAELYQQYVTVLRSRNLVDYDDLIALAGTLLRTKPEIAEAIRARWDYILVDEFQDLSLAQYGVIAALAAKHRNCFAVGDDEQSIFGWTGADPHVLDRFRTDFGIAAPIVLDENRRCSTEIFAVARRLIAWNPALFEKDIRADRSSPFDVAAYGFQDEAAEARWLLDDLERDHAAHGLSWGDYALLYRTHAMGQHLETRLLERGIPCRLARGQSLVDDEIIGYVIACLRVIHAPDDPIAIEALAERLLTKPVVDQARNARRDLDLVTALRVFAAGRSRQDPDAKLIWRFVYHVANLSALRQAHTTLSPLIDELLAGRVGPYRNPLAEHAGELTDPLEFPDARRVLERLLKAVAARTPVYLLPHGGVEIALRQMIGATGMVTAEVIQPDQALPADAVVLGPNDARPGHWPLLVFKALQLLHTRDVHHPFPDYVAFDIETTDLDVDACEIVEIAAIRVRHGVPDGEFHRLVRVTRPISPRATEIHGYRDADLVGQPSFAEIWPAFREFVGKDLLVAHNGQEFDVPVLQRLAADLPRSDDLVFFDTLPLARSLLDQSAKLENLAKSFGVEVGRAHHALDDARMLVGVVPHLDELKHMRTRKSALANALGWLGLALAIGDDAEPTAEEKLLRELAVPATLGRYSNCLEIYAEECAAAGAPPVETIIDRLGGPRLLEKLRAERSPAERYPIAVARLQALVTATAAPTLAESIGQFLSRTALSTSEGPDTDERRVNLLTLHATKGLEFSRVYVVGAEDRQLPGYSALENNDEKEIQEGRRLLYVGMTRAKDRLILTYSALREGRPSGGSLFLKQAGLSVLAPD